MDTLIASVVALLEALGHSSPLPLFVFIVLAFLLVLFAVFRMAFRALERIANRGDDK
jgi:hypothetical protein